MSRLQWSLVLLLLTGSVPALAQSQVRFQGFFSARAIDVHAQPSWVEGGAGRFDVGAHDASDRALRNVLVAQLGLDWTPRTWFLLHADGIARHEPQGTRGRRVGLVQAFADVVGHNLRLRAGMFWLPTSRENLEPLWTSRYTITDSALNTWIGQEVRPIGADLEYSPNFYVKVGGTAFRGLNTMGTMIAERGWSFGNRLSVYEEQLPTPEGGLTRPIGTPRIGKTGFSERVRVQLPERAMLQIAHIDNHAPQGRKLDGFEPWSTRFNIVSAEAGSSSPTTIASEWAWGSTSVRGSGSLFSVDFRTAYLLISHKSGANRWTARVDRFSTSARAESRSGEHGNGVTLAWLRDVTARIRAGAEYADVTGSRAEVGEYGFNPMTGGSTLLIEIRYAIGQP